ncbi:putative follistatin-related protein 5 [Apostichopus japonicus]|uniref:Putative follistatin-related protein 5 n=1 Tax=Stichopus japonicus TaxID=307972 RepID=A0A2G8JZ15_STIJA|nr:putative follistatin-related protein 5 [Apostichopus japonicus]
MYHSDDRLYIVNIQVIHIGEYTCYAAAYPNVRQVVMVTVEVPPSVAMCPHNQLTARGSSAKVKCYAEGVPTPKKSWVQNQNPLDIGEKYQLDDFNSSLMIHHIDYADTGIFDCLATNEAGTQSASASVFIRDSSSSSDFNSNNIYYFFHKSGIQVVDPDTCAFQESFHADLQLPDENGALCKVNKTTGERECNWGSAVTVKNRYIYATQPMEYRILVVDLRLGEIIEVIKTDKLPVALTYISHLDSIWIEGWRNKNRLTGLHGVKVIRSASEPPPHYTIHLEPSGNHFDAVESVHIPAEQMTGQGEMHYGYLIHRDQQGLSKIDLRSLTHEGRVNLRDYDCHPNSVAFVAIGGYVIVNCDATDGEQERQLFVDYVTNEVICVNEGVQGQIYVTPDGRYVISVDRAEQHIQVQKVTDDGQIKTDFQVSTNLHISDLGFYPTMSSHAYDLIATSRNREEAIYINLETGKVEMISGMHEPISENDWKWDSHNRKIAPSGFFGPYMVSPSADHVIILNGQYRRLHCDVDHLVNANVFAWVGLC